MFFWLCLKETLYWERVPVSIVDFQLNWLDRRGATDYNVILFSFAASVWTLWNVRNRGAFEGVYPRQPMDMIYKFLSCLQRWRTLLTGDEHTKLDNFMKTVEEWSKDFCSLSNRACENL